MKQLGIDGIDLKLPFHVFRDYAHSQYREAIGIAPTWGPKEYNSLKRLFKACPTDCMEIWSMFLCDRRPYVAGHNPAKCYAERDSYRECLRPTKRSQKDPAFAQFVQETVARRKAKEAENAAQVEPQAVSEATEPGFDREAAKRAIQELRRKL